jgi:hypothetical protein
MGPDRLPQNGASELQHLRWYLLPEVFVSALLFLLALVLIPSWVGSGALIWPDLLGQMFSPHTLAALGLALVLRQGSIDLSVWAAFSLGAAAAALVIQAGSHPLLALAAVVGVGLGLGGIHALAVVGMKLPGWGVTLITGTLGVSVVAAATDGEAVKLAMEHFDRWPGASRPVFMAGTFYIAALLALARLSSRSYRQKRPRLPAKLAGALVASAVLSSLGGLCWLLKSGQTCLPGYLVGDLRILAAAVLAGAAGLPGRGRSLLVCAMLPLAMLVTTVWRFGVWPTPLWPVPANLLALAGMAWAAQWIFVRVRRPAARLGIVWPVLAALGVVSLAATAAAEIPGRDVFRSIVGVVLWVIGTGGAVLAWLHGRTPNKPHA